MAIRRTLRLKRREQREQNTLAIMRPDPTSVSGVVPYSGLRQGRLRRPWRGRAA